MAEDLAGYLKNLERTKRHIKALEWIISNDLGVPVQIENITCCDARLKDGRLYCLEKRTVVDRHCVFYDQNDI